ncbi:C1 family peptidase [Tropicimonas sp. TH_r6]|uniref:C1 family peptidase n=1 Tax=Tropicimonas sp. TH_r6 TaxID=3082085 RepID=UPI002953D6C2|nr:C1 family peptidase [Tropicimonas sp. TH_r6]MDV7143983.1 C1 family peptidase [Tropicimonas sp. TH_r6]
MSKTSELGIDQLTVEGVRRDWVDLRDYHYTPSLATLRGECLPADVFFANGAGPSFGLRDQGENGRCVGYALANLIDIQRSLQSGRRLQPDEQVSADMLYCMARFHEAYGEFATSHRSEGPSGEGVRSLRSAIKGFYHHGVCLDHPRGCHIADALERARRWKSLSYWETGCSAEQAFPSVEQAQAAHQISLGAYFRLRPVLNHYHAALNETGAVLVSTGLTEGWQAPDPDGKIAHGQGIRPLGGAHAVVLVGYTREGFLVLNSWGKWGGYRGYDGVALWRYADWAENLRDGWVLRLGVTAPEAFDLTIGEQGTNRIYGSIQAGSVPCRELLGHFLHLDDGHHVELGAYPSTDELVDKMMDFLDARLDATKNTPERRYHGVVVWFAGSLETIDEGFPAAVRRKKWLQEQGLFLITVFWCNDFVEQAMGVLQQVFAECRELAGKDADHLDRLIETRARGIGRAFWRDIERAAERSVEGVFDFPRDPPPTQGKKGHVHTLLDKLTSQAKTYRTSLHIVTEGAGVLPLTEWLEMPLAGEQSRVAQSMQANARHTRLWTRAGQVSSVQLALPAIDLLRARGQGGLLDFLELLNDGAEGWQSQVNLLDDATRPVLGEGEEVTVGEPPRVRIYVPDGSLERRIHLGDYGQSILHLVANAFEDRRDPQPDAPARVMLGMACAPDCILRGEMALSADTGEQTDTKHPLFSRISQPSGQSDAAGKIEQQDLTRHAALEREILETILKLTN